MSVIKPHAEILKRISRDGKKLRWWWWADPAGATCFAVLFLAINPYSKKVYILDEIYEKRQAEMTTKRIGARILKIRSELYDRPDRWRQGYDEAATWFANEWRDAFPDEGFLEPSQKAKHKKEDGLSLIKDMMLLNLLECSDRCVNFIKEMSSYQKDKNGNIPKKDDHLIDDFRYTLGAEFYNLEGVREVNPEANPDFRGASLKSDLAAAFGDDYDFY